MLRKPIVAIAAAALGVAGCGGSSSSSKPAAGTSTGAGVTAPAPSAATGPPYNPKIEPAKFTDHITNPYWPIKPGARWTYSGMKDGVPESVEVRVSNERKTVLGVRCVVVSDIVTSNHTLTEKTTDWYAQDDKGSLWYFGEDTKEYVNGVVSSTKGTWEAGVDGAKPGVVIQASPVVGRKYRQEYRPGLAEDMAQALKVSATATVPAGTFHGVLITRDTDPLNPDKIEHKEYARGVGPVHVIRVGGSHHEEIKLVKKTG